MNLFGDADWQTVALFLAIFLFAAWYLARANNKPDSLHANFHLLDLIADDGKLNRRELRATGVWLICTAIVVVYTIRGEATWEWMVAYATLFFLEKGIDVYKSTAIRRAEIIRGRAEDVDINTGRTAEEMTVEEQEAAAYKGKERRKKRLLG
ncbi:MAG: hypothetical protein H0V63_08405 [Burkholderiaceae bacterium]|nr:hypothetical protein [Burkholderiaceae bacterium]